jgi:hypothetical protein
MLRNLKDNFTKKSLKERFLLFIGILFFMFYLTLGLGIIFWKPAEELEIAPQYRIAFGVLLIVYSFFRFLRFFNSNKE